MHLPYPQRPKTLKYEFDDVELFLSYFHTYDLRLAVEEFESIFVEMPEALSYLDLLEKEVMKGRLPWHSLYIAFDYRIRKDEFEQAKKYPWIMKYWEYKGLNDTDNI